jgi:uncharacterized protein (DUF1499 family)
MLLALASRSGRHAPSVSLVDGRLRPAPAKPNCVCSEAGTPADAAVAPLMFADAPDAAWARARTAVTALGGHVERDADDHLWATFRTRLLRFVDDLELRLDRAGGVIHVRSASRVGHSDLGTNRRRVEELRRRFALH